MGALKRLRSKRNYLIKGLRVSRIVEEIKTCAESHERDGNRLTANLLRRASREIERLRRKIVEDYQRDSTASVSEQIKEQR